jgi:hypothetical protein
MYQAILKAMAPANSINKYCTSDFIMKEDFLHGLINLFFQPIPSGAPSQAAPSGDRPVRCAGAKVLC